MNRYETENGRLIELSPPQRIGGGGEGVVLPVLGEPGLVAKLYHRPTTEQQRKIELMLSAPLPQPNGHRSVAWPTEMLFAREPGGPFTGYVMPRVCNAGRIFAVYNPAVRRRQCPDFDFRYLVRTARNLASTFALAHQHGYVIGDGNESNIFVSSTACVIFVDSDSWQVEDSFQGRIYRCPVGRPEFTPPELQGMNFQHVDRDESHDGFALGVLIFKLLNEGDHPFDGVYHGSSDPPSLEARIRMGAVSFRQRFACWTPKPTAVPFGTLHFQLQRLFIQCFEQGHSHPEARPNAVAWQQALATAEKDLQQCPQNEHHRFWGRRCIWCERRDLLGGLDPFPGQIPARQLPVVRQQTVTRRVPKAPINPKFLGHLTLATRNEGKRILSAFVWEHPSPPITDYFRALLEDSRRICALALANFVQSPIPAFFLLIATTLGLGGAALLPLIIGIARLLRSTFKRLSSSTVNKSNP